MSFEYPVLLADIGGTNCRMMTLASKHATPQPLARLASADIIDLPATLSALPGLPPVRSALLAVAGVVESPRMTLTNLPWSIDAQAIGKKLGLTRVMLVNDFEAQAAAMTVFDARDCETLQDGAAKPDGVRAIVGAGTGFGAAFLLATSTGHILRPSEAGHMDLALMPGDDALFADAMRLRYGRLEIEALVSGPGLARLEAALHRRVRMRDTAEIVAAALAGEAEAR
ncbi:MAG: glucokinase, partial [Beijerinckiaceae bacterium]